MSWHDHGDDRTDTEKLQAKVIAMEASLDQRNEATKVWIQSDTQCRAYAIQLETERERDRKRIECLQKVVDAVKVASDRWCIKPKCQCWVCGALKAYADLIIDSRQHNPTLISADDALKANETGGGGGS